jgi:DNA-binding transcriptional ArsR family regulator
VQQSAKDLEDYLKETLHAPVRLERWRGATALPAYLTGQYGFLDGSIGNVRVLFLQSAEEPVPSVAKKHERALQQHWTGAVAFAFPRVTPRTRQRMVSEGLPFVVPGSQVYLPFLGTSLRERYAAPRTSPAERLRPSAQVLFLASLMNPASAADTPTEAAKRLGYTAMAMGQALTQLEDAGLMRVRKEGRERRFGLADDPAVLWERAQTLLASPVSRRHHLAGVPASARKGPVAGLSALATYSAIAEPGVLVVALDRAKTKALLGAKNIEELTGPEEADLTVEVWSYDPALLSKAPAVDRLSLYLSLREDPDERVQAALAEMMRGMAW